MQSPLFYVFLTLIALCLVFFNSLLSKDIYQWVPSIKKQIGLYLLVWLLPIIGFYLANKFGKLGWLIKRRSKKKGSVASGGFLEMDSFFNPSTQYTIEIIEQQKSDMYQEDKQSDDEYKNTK